MAQIVVPATLVGVGQDILGALDLLEPIRGVVAVADVRMPLFDLPAVRTPDFSFVGIL